MQAILFYIYSFAVLIKEYWTVGRPHTGNVLSHTETYMNSLFFEIEVTVNPVPQVNNVTNQTRCAGDDTALITFGTANSGGTTTYAWQMNTDIGAGLSGSGNLNPFTTVNNTNATIVATITVTPTFTNGGVSCTGPPEEFEITVNPTPVIDDKAPDPICSGGSFIVTPTNGNGDIVPTGTNYTWTMVPSNVGLVGALSGSDITTISEVLTNNTNTVQTATYTVTPKSGDCEGEDFDIVVTVNPVAVVTAAPSPEVICTGATTSITFTPGSTGTVPMTYSWTASVTTTFFPDEI